MKLSAFTLIELIVVMAISAILITLGISGMLLFRNTAQFQQTEGDLTANLNSARNKARNSVSSQVLLQGGADLEGAKVDGYAIFPVGGNYSLYYCNKTGGGLIQVNCSVEAANLKPAVFDAVTVSFDDPGNCAGVFFERLTGQIYTLNGTSSAFYDRVCTLTLRHTASAGLTRSIILDPVNNSISL